MSLLTDVLRKAEEAKRPGTEGTHSKLPANSPGELSLEPVAATLASSSAHATSPLPDLSLHLDSLNADLAAASAAAPTYAKRPVKVPDTTSHNEKERSAAHKSLASGPARQARQWRWRLSGLAACATLGLCGYLWWQQEFAHKGAFVAAQASTENVQAGALAPAAMSASTPDLPAARVRLPAVNPELAEQASAAGSPNRPARAEARADTAAPSADSDSPIRLSSKPPTTNPPLSRAYESLQAQQLNDAQRDYELVLRGDPHNVDALLGLASIAAQREKPTDAAELYARALEADPKDPYALAGLINLRGQGDPGLSESRLKTLLASQPDAPALNFALGNQQARQGRWGDAQQAYFRACTGEPANADYLYNLAVSLDHLRHRPLAAQYYRSALNAAEGRASAFDKSQVNARLLDLQP
jgi:tetratricopeptide (TPR) repeat protein